MFGIGAQELVIIVVVGLLLFGTPLLTFLLGYTLGRKSPAPPATPTNAGDEKQELPE